MLDDTKERGSLGKERMKYLTEWDFQRTKVQHEGKHIVLPADPGNMELRTAAKHLNKLADEDEMEVDVNETIACYPFDGLIALNDAMAFLFGWSSPTPTPSFFGPIPPEIISVQTGPEYGDYRQVPVGSFTIPAMEDKYRVNIGMTGTPSNPNVYIAATVPRKYERIIRMIAKKARELLAQNSIYRGKAIRVHTNDNGIDYSQQPEFFATGAITEDDLHLNDSIMRTVETSILTPIKHMDKCKQAQVPLKRGVLLEGPYGVGKTLISRITSKVATQNGWTFILIEDVSALRSALELAKTFQPCVVFAEDLDRAVKLDRDDVANEILNTVDGVLSKSAEVMVVFTTNHVERIAKAMLRPGRLDAVISVRPPDAKTCASLIRYYGRGLISAEENIDEACAMLSGQIPAVIREVVERAKLHGIPNCTEDGQLPAISGIDLLATAEQMTNHLALLNSADDAPTDAENLFNSLGRVVAKFAIGGNATGLATQDDIEESVEEIKSHVDSNANRTNRLVKDVAPSEKRLVDTTITGLKKAVDPRVLRA